MATVTYLVEFKIVAHFFENRIEERVGYHREIPWRMKLSIPVEDALKLRAIYSQEIERFLQQLAS